MRFINSLDNLVTGTSILDLCLTGRGVPCKCTWTLPLLHIHYRKIFLQKEFKLMTLTEESYMVRYVRQHGNLSFQPTETSIHQGLKCSSMSFYFSKESRSGLKKFFLEGPLRKNLREAYVKYKKKFINLKAFKNFKGHMKNIRKILKFY